LPAGRTAVRTVAPPREEGGWPQPRRKIGLV
jgi:hypothetical protein